MGNGERTPASQENESARGHGGQSKWQSGKAILLVELVETVGDAYWAFLHFVLGDLAFSHLGQHTPDKTANLFPVATLVGQKELGVQGEQLAKTLGMRRLAYAT